MIMRFINNKMFVFFYVLFLLVPAGSSGGRFTAWVLDSSSLHCAACVVVDLDTFTLSRVNKK